MWLELDLRGRGAAWEDCFGLIDCPSMQLDSSKVPSGPASSGLNHWLIGATRCFSFFIFDFSFEYWGSWLRSVRLASVTVAVLLNAFRVSKYNFVVMTGPRRPRRVSVHLSKELKNSVTVQMHGIIAFVRSCCFLLVPFLNIHLFSRFALSLADLLLIGTLLWSAQYVQTRNSWIRR